VYIGGRNKARVEKSIKDIKKEADRRMGVAVEGTVADRRWVGELRFLEIDLLDLQTVISACRSLKSKEAKIDLLILNAGVGALPYSITKDGFEIQFQTNYISQYLLTLNLLDVCHTDCRVIYVSSIANFLEFFQFKREWTFNLKPNFIFTWFRYSLSKNSGIQLMKFLALTKPELKYFSIHPGFVMNTNFFSYWTRIPIFGIFFWFFFQIFGFFAGCSNEEGSYATLRCCLSNDILLEENGSYFTTGGALGKLGRLANDLNSITYNYIWTKRELEKRGYEFGN
jgi:NAD(P)-dependent dehydrogenase (short-subunit alcohol dehydrogenase family)